MALQTDEQFPLELRSPLTWELVASPLVGEHDLVLGVKMALESLLDVPRCCLELLRDGLEMPLLDNTSLCEAGVSRGNPVLQVMIQPAPEGHLSEMCQRAAELLTSCRYRSFESDLSAILGHHHCCGQACIRHAVRHCEDPDATLVPVNCSCSSRYRCGGLAGLRCGERLLQRDSRFSWVKGNAYSPLHLAAEYGDATTCSLILQDARFAKVVKECAMGPARKIASQGGTFRLPCGQDFRQLCGGQGRRYTSLALVRGSALPFVPALNTWLWSDKECDWLPCEIARQKFKKGLCVRNDVEGIEAGDAIGIRSRDEREERRRRFLEAKEHSKVARIHCKGRKTQRRKV